MQTMVKRSCAERRAGAKPTMACAAVLRVGRAGLLQLQTCPSHDGMLGIVSFRIAEIASERTFSRFCLWDLVRTDRNGDTECRNDTTILPLTAESRRFSSQWKHGRKGRRFWG